MSTLVEVILVFLMLMGIIVGSTLLGLFIAQIITNKKMKSNKSLEPKDKEQLEYYINKDYSQIIHNNKDSYKIEDLDFYYLDDIVEDVYDICHIILIGQKKLYRTKEEVLEKEFVDTIKKINNKELNEIYKEMQKVKKIAFKYYDEEGNLIVKK